MKFELLTSAIVFYAVFMLNEPATTPKNPKAKIIFGLLCGVLTMLFRYYGSFEIGGCFALLLINATEGYWDRLFDKKAPHHNEEAVVRQPAEKTPVHAEKKAEPETEKAESKKVYKAVECDKHAKAKQSKTSVGATISMISRAEDNLDQVEFSTLSIDVGEALKAFEEKYNKEDR